ncbi:MAG: hypothetical protein ACKVPJ_06130 [Chitinophagales bacterium]
MKNFPYKFLKVLCLSSTLFFYHLSTGQVDLEFDMYVQQQENEERIQKLREDEKQRQIRVDDSARNMIPGVVECLKLLDKAISKNDKKTLREFYEKYTYKFLTQIYIDTIDKDKTFIVGAELCFCTELEDRILSFLIEDTIDGIDIQGIDPTSNYESYLLNENEHILIYGLIKIAQYMVGTNIDPLPSDVNKPTGDLKKDNEYYLTKIEEIMTKNAEELMMDNWDFKGYLGVEKAENISDDLQLLKYRIKFIKYLHKKYNI